MDIEFTDKIRFTKELNSLDEFVIEFISVLDKLKIKYVLISGYVSILFGRNRSSEDIDILVEKLDYESFENMWRELDESFECITTSNPKDAFEKYLSTKHAIRFSFKDEFIPNMEIKFPKIELESWVLENRKEVIVNKIRLFISPIELQISFKVFLGSEKDIEDAKYLYELFKENLDISMLDEFNRKLNIVENFNRYVR